MKARVTVKPKGRFHHGDLRAALIAAATNLVDVEGHEAVTLRRVALAVGVTEPAVYRHFESKDALLGAVGNVGYQRFVAACVAGAASEEPLDAVGGALRAYVRFAAEHPRWFQLWSSRRWNSEIQAVNPEDTVARRQASMEGLRGLLARGVAEDAPVDDLFRSLWALAHGLSHLVVDRAFQLVDTDAARVAAADEAIAVALEGMRTRYGRAG